MRSELSATEWLIAATVVVIMVAAFVGAYHESERWEQFRAERHCRVVGHDRGGTAWGVSTGGDMTTVQMPDKTGCACDDGVTYWR